MAISRNNALLSNASGTIGRQIVIKKYYDKTVISNMPDMSRRVLSEKQIEANERMKDANQYARYFYSTEENKLKSRLRLKLPAHKSLYHGLVKEYMIKYADLSIEEAVKKAT